MVKCVESLAALALSLGATAGERARHGPDFLETIGQRQLPITDDYRTALHFRGWVLFGLGAGLRCPVASQPWVNVCRINGARDGTAGPRDCRSRGLRQIYA